MPLETSPVPASLTMPDPQPQDSSRASQNTENPSAGTDLVATATDEAEILHASIKAGSVAQIVVAVIAVIGLIYLLKLVMVAALTSILLAFVSEPLVSRLVRIDIPRAAGALLAVALMVGLVGGLTDFFYNRGVDFATQVSKYSGKIRSTLANLQAQTHKIEESTRSVITSPNGKSRWRLRFNRHQVYRT